MAHTKSARKRIRQDRKRHLRNQSVKTHIRTLTKRFRASLSEGDEGQTSTVLKEAIRALDKAATKGVVHRRTASRKIARLSRAARGKMASSSSEAPSVTS